MSTITFDSLNLVRELRQAGITQDHAEAIINSISKAQEGLVSTDHFDNRISASEAKTTATIAEAKTEIIKWNIGAIIAATSLALAAAKLIH